MSDQPYFPHEGDKPVFNVEARTAFLRRWIQLQTERSSWMAHWMDISRYLLPRNGRYFVTDRNKGIKRHNNILDNTATRSLKVLAAGMLSGMASPARPWFEFKTNDPELDKNPAVKAWLNQVRNLILAVFERSNTYRTLHNQYLELGAFGASCSIIAPDFRNVIHHHQLTIGEYGLAMNWKREVDTLYREFEMPVGAVVKEFGLENCSMAVQTQYRTGLLDTWVRIIHLIEPRADRDPSSPLAKHFKYRSVYFEPQNNEGDKCLRVSGMQEFNVIAPRWQVVGSDIYGESPAMDALGDIKQLQHEQLRKGEGIDYMTKPPVVLSSNLKGHEVDTLPGGVTFLDTSNPQMVKSLFDVRLDLGQLLGDIQDVRGRIKQAFFEDIFLMLANDPAGQMTATEVAERHEEKMLMMGPVIERLQNEQLGPLVELTFAQILRATGPNGQSLLPKAPQALHGMDLGITYTSLLAQAQRAVQNTSTDRFVTAIGSVATFKPEVLDNFNADAWAEIYADNLGLDPTLIVPAAQVALIRKQRAQQQAQASAADLAQQGSQALKNLSTVDTSGPNLAADAMRGLSGYGT